MANADVYRITDKLDDITLSAIEERLEARGKHPRFRAMMNDYLEAMNIDEAKLVLDVGCGTGVVARAIARRTGFNGRIVGVDRSPYLVEVAKRLAQSEEVDSKVEFHAGDSQSLHLEDQRFDAVVAHTLLSHVEDPLAVVKEMLRVVKSGRSIGIFDGDYASLTFALEDAQKSQALDDMIIGAIITHPRLMRQMPQLLRQAGATLLNSFSYVVADVGRADFFAPFVKTIDKLLPKAGAMNEAAAKQLAAQLQRHSDDGVFFGATNFYGYVAKK